MIVIVGPGTHAAEVRAAIGAELPACLQVLALDDAVAIRAAVRRTAETHLVLGDCPQCVATDIRSLADSMSADASPAPAIGQADQAAVDRQRFSAREQEIMDLLAGGTTVAQIAARLYLAERTIRNVLTRAYQKLGVHRQSMAIVTWRELCR